MLKGDKIYFRVGSRFNGYHDQVSWSPEISYTREDVSLVDANNKSLYRFSASEDFVISAPQRVTVPTGGQLVIEGLISKTLSSDDVLTEVLKIKGEDTLKIWQKRFSFSEQTSFHLKQTIRVDSADAFSFRIRSATGINPSSVKWQPHLYYIATDDPINHPASDELGRPTIEFYPLAAYDFYTKTVAGGTSYQMREDKDTLKIVPLLSFNNPFSKGEVVFSVKSINKLLYKDTLWVSAGKLNFSDTIKVVALKGEKFYMEYHLSDTKLAAAILLSRTSVTIGKKTQVPLSGAYTTIEEPIFGPMYRGWGHFAYNGNGDRAHMRILETELKVSQQVEEAKELEGKEFKSTEELESNEKIYKASEEVFVILVPMVKKKASLSLENVPLSVVWNGYDEYTYLDGFTISSSRNGEDSPQTKESLAKSLGGGKRAVNKIAVSTGKSFSIGGGVGPAKDAGFSASGSYGKNEGQSKVMVDFMDMNGDRYPDVVTPGRVQYSTPWGGLRPGLEANGIGEVNHQTTTLSNGVTLSGSYSQPAVTPLAFNIKKTKVSVGSGKNSAGLSGNYAKGENHSDFSLMDINGDGLPDRVYRNGMVALNIGYGFEAREMWFFSEISGGESKSIGGGASVSLVNGSISAGIGVSTSHNHVKESLMDINGDGLLDILHYEEDKPLKVRLNTGGGFLEETVWKGTSYISKSSSTSKSANLAFTVDFPIMTGIRMVINPSTNVGHSVTRDLAQFSDVDGDGYPDMVQSGEDKQMHVSRSKIGRSNLLQSVTRPMGASIALDYVRKGNSYQMPQAMWALSKVELQDGYSGDGEDRLLSTFAYGNGYHDRTEREFYGFEKVTTYSHDTGEKDKVSSMTIQTFNNDDYYKKGLLLAETFQDGDGKKYVEKKNSYEVKEVQAGSIFAALKETKESYYEGGSEAKKRTSALYSYNEYGNMISYTDNGDEGAGDDIVATVSYHELSGPYIMSLPKEISVRSNGKLLRKREVLIDSKGNVREIKQYLEDGKASVHSLSYDSYGNLSSVTRPANAKGERLSMGYEYDKEVNTYVTKASNSYGYSSEASYDYLFGQVLQSKDLNGQEIHYALVQ